MSLLLQNAVPITKCVGGNVHCQEHVTNWSEE